MESLLLSIAWTLGNAETAGRALQGPQGGGGGVGGVGGGGCGCLPV